MPIDYYDATNGDGLFQVLGKMFCALDAINTARGGTLPAHVQNVLRQFDFVSNPSLELTQTLEGLPGSMEAGARGLDVLSAGLRANAEQYLLQIVEEDDRQASRELTTALTYLIEVMERDGYYVEANTVALTLATVAGNVGDVTIGYSHRRGDGRAQENLLAERIQVDVAGEDADAPTIQFAGRLSAGDPLVEDWPQGSGAAVQVSAARPGDGLLTNGDFEVATNEDVPDGWTIDVGTVGTTVYLTDPEVQTVAISGTPTGGTYHLRAVHPVDGVTRTTTPLAYDAAATDVQDALRELPGFEEIEVADTGTSPDLTHTVTFTGVAGNVGTLSSINLLTGGSPAIAHATTTAGDDGAWRGRSLVMVGDGAQLTTLHQALTLEYDTPYLCYFRVKKVGAAAAGELRVEIVDGIGGSVTVDEDGNSNALTISVPALTGDHDGQFVAFRIKRDYTQPVYLRVRLSTAPTAGVKLYLDDFTLVAASELYAGGPFVAAFTGRELARVGDTWNLYPTNNRAGYFQEWFHRTFDMAGRRLLLPIAGTTQIPDSAACDEESSSSSSSSSSSTSSKSSSSSSSSASSSSSSSTSSSSSSRSSQTTSSSSSTSSNSSSSNSSSSSSSSS